MLLGFEKSNHGCSGKFDVWYLGRCVSLVRQVLGKKKEYIDERWIDIWEAEESKFKLDVAQMCGCEIKEEFAPGCRNLKMVSGLYRPSFSMGDVNFRFWHH